MFERLTAVHAADSLSRVVPKDSPAERHAEHVADRVDSFSEAGDRGVLARLQTRLHHDFSRVKVHTAGAASHAADVLGACAFAFGSHVVFGTGQHRPGTVDGNRLYAHELAHVAQTGGATSAGVLLHRRPQCHDGRLTTAQYLEGVAWLEESGAITTEEADSLKTHVPKSRQVRCQMIGSFERRAQRGRTGSTRDARDHQRKNHVITNFSVTPRTIHTDRGEAARIQFDVASTATGVTAYIIKYETERPDARFFRLAQTPGHKVAVWDGTFTGSRRYSPEPGTYWVRVWASDADGNQEDRVEQIVVRNDSKSTVLPRTESGLGLRSLRFDGRRAVLTDDGGHEISARAVSGLRANNPHNFAHRDFTDPRFQGDAMRGPIPAGTYFIDGNAAQMPEMVAGKLRYPSGAGAAGWGPFRVPLRPATSTATHGRDQFFFHLDTKNDGTAGCIGISPSDEGRFNQMMALIMRIPTGHHLQVEVSY